jgi:hypothetical protein
MSERTTPRPSSRGPHAYPFGRPFGAPWTDAFLRELEAGTDQREAATLVDICLAAAYPERERNPEFARRWDEIEYANILNDLPEAEARS